MNIFKTILGWFATVERKTHDSIVAPLQHMVDELHDYAAHHAMQQITKTGAIQEIEKQILVHESEAAKAVATATRLGGIIG